MSQLLSNALVGQVNSSYSPEVLVLYRKRAHTPCSCSRLAPSRFRYNPKTYRYRSAQPGQLPVCRPLAQNASFLAFHTANLDGWRLAQNLVSVLRRTGSADSAEPSRSSCTERPGCSKAANWSPFFSSLSPLRRAFGRRLLQRRTP